ncbi:putative bifunctional diguanylate cyclase/phosphodiesterase [Novosphingobium sp.]|uniref:putative bifunctional diguanylate cyclase/phosphodiesterase n=1 Tax=Novosphingobium sp. TaxID=1874826 RepID=UPI0038B7BB02
MTGNLRVGGVALATLMALMALSVALAAAFQHATSVADDLARREERVHVARFLQRAMETGAQSQRGLIGWDETFEHAVLKVDPVWTDREFGKFVGNTQGIATILLVAPDGTLLRGWRDGRRANDLPYAHLRWQIEGLIAKALNGAHTLDQRADTMKLAGGRSWPTNAAGMPNALWESGIASVANRPSIITVASIVPDRRPLLLQEVPNFLVTIQPLNEHVLARMSEDLALPVVGFADNASTLGSRNALPLFAVDGSPLGVLHWEPREPGPTIYRRTTPLLIVWIMFFIGVVVGGATIFGRTRRAAHELAASEAQAQHNALHDSMSGLPNRTHFMQRLRSELTACIEGRQPGDVFVAYLDIDSFKVVNDTLGHHVGDELVRQVAHRLRRKLPAGDFISRFGGDEFVLLRHGEGGKAAADALGEEVLALMREPFLISGTKLDISCSCGISWGPEHSEDPGELLRRADIALYRAKQRGRARYRRFTRDMDASLKLRREMELELRRAIAHNELTVAYQPIVGIASGEVKGFEALLRWNHPERGAIRPDLFVPIAEQGGLMVSLGTWMLRSVFTETRHWPESDISVNLSPLQIMAGDFLQTMERLIDETGIDPERVILEITEGVMLDRSEHVVVVLRGLARLGFRIALDDFGIGYSSLSYLRSFQFNRIKIDRSFVSNIEADLDAHAILCAIVALGNTLRMKVVAEGVETETQRRLVQAAGCELVQGFLFWPALSGAEARDLLLPSANRLRRVG